MIYSLVYIQWDNIGLHAAVEPDPGQMFKDCNISPPGMGEKPLIYQVAVNPGCSTLSRACIYYSI